MYRNPFEDRLKPKNRKRFYGKMVLDNEKKVVYSYGAHYPLLFTVRGIDFVNDRGYSVTTAGHISMAWRWAKHSVELFSPGYTRYADFSAQAVIGSLKYEYMSLCIAYNDCRDLRGGSYKRDAIIGHLCRTAEALDVVNEPYEVYWNGYSDLEQTQEMWAVMHRVTGEIIGEEYEDEDTAWLVARELIRKHDAEGN